MGSFLARTGSKSDADVERREPVSEIPEMLFRQYLGGCHQGSLITRFDRKKHCRCSHQGLARPDIALQQSAHRNLSRHIPPDFSDRALLSRSGPEGEHGKKSLRQFSGSDVTVAFEG